MGLSSVVHITSFAVFAEKLRESDHPPVDVSVINSRDDARVPLSRRVLERGS